MGKNVYFKITGGERIKKALLGLEKKVARKVVRVAAKEGAAIIKAAVIEEAPKDSGDLAGSVKMKTRSRKGVFTATVTIGARNFKGETFYAAFIQYGTPGTEPNPFMDRAFDRKKDEAAKAMEAALLKGVLAEVRKST